MTYALLTVSDPVPTDEVEAVNEFLELEIDKGNEYEAYYASLTTLKEGIVIHTTW